MKHITIEWFDDKKKLFVYRFENDWQWPDYQQAIDEASEMMAEVEHDINILMDVTRVKTLPPGAISHIRKAFANPRAKNIQLTVIAGASPFMVRIAEVVQKISSTLNWDYVVVGTLEEAYEILGVQADV